MTTQTSSDVRGGLLDASPVTHGSVRLSIIIPCYNYRDFVGRAIESVLGQLNDSSELLIVDDGSTDGSWEVIARYCVPKSFRLENGSALKACLHGLGQSRGSFVMFLDADDALAPGSLARILPHLKPGVSKLQFPLTPIDATGQVIGPPSPEREGGAITRDLQREVLATGCYMSPPTSGNIFSRELCQLLYEIDYEGWVDGVTLFAAPFYGEVIHLPEPLGFYRIHGRNGSQAGARPDAARFGVEAQRFLDRHEHLRRILLNRGVQEPLVDGRSAFFYRERRLYQAVFEGRRPDLGDVLVLQRMVPRMERSARYRLAMSLLFWLLYLLPRGARDALLERRLERGPRTLTSFLKTLMQRRRDPMPA